jgi:hypothetical protein
VKVPTAKLTVRGAAVCAAVLIAATGCAGPQVAPSSGSTSSTAGPSTAVTETRDVRGFGSVEFSAAGTLTIDQTGTDSLEIRTKRDLLPLLTTEVQGTTLRIGFKPGVDIASIGNTPTLAYRLTVDKLNGLVVSGVGEVTATGLDGDELSVAHGGAANVVLAGRVTNQIVKLTGLGEYDGSKLESQDADVSVSGEGQAVVNASRTLRAQISGVGEVAYLGNPQVTQDVTGIGQVIRR